MNYAILRTKKFHYLSELSKVGRHNGRATNVPNADQSRSERNIDFLSQEGELSHRVAAKLKGVKKRKNAVIACEVIMTCTAGALNPNLHNEWLQICMDFAVKQFGDQNIVQAIGHNDEAAPHLHIIFVPINHHGKLNCRAVLGGPEKLRKLQDEFFANCGRDYGLSRGNRGSSAEHIPMRELYRMTDHPANVEVPMPPEPPSLAIGSAKEEYQKSAQAEQQAEIDKQLTPLKQQAERTRLAELRVKQSEWKNSMLLTKTQALEADLKAERNRLRDLPLNEVLSALGYEGKKEGTNYTRYETQLGKLVVNSDGRFFINGAEKGGKGAINLVMALEGMDFQASIAVLRDKFGSQPVASAALNHVQENIIPALIDSKKNPPRKALDELDERHIPAIRKYLVEKRHLPGAIIDVLISIGDIAANKFGSVVFCMRDEYGVIKGQIIRATTSAFKTIRKIADSWFRLGAELSKAKRAIVVESPIDAISYPAKEGDAVISFGGANPAATSLHKALCLLRKDCEVVAALDNDSAGQQGNRRIIEMAAQIGRSTATEIPRAKDWNEDFVANISAEDEGSDFTQLPGRGI